MTTRRYRQPTEHDLAVEDLPRVERRARAAITEALGAEFELEICLLCAADGRMERWLMLEEAMRREAETSGWNVEGTCYGGCQIDAHNGIGGWLELRLTDGELVLVSGWQHARGGERLGRHAFKLPAGVAKALAGRAA